MIRVLTMSMVILAAPLMAHHSFAAEYDEKKAVTLKGVVTKSNGRIRMPAFSVDVKDDKGNVTNWNLELASPNVLVRNGWKRNSLQVGDAVEVSGSQAKDGSNMGERARRSLYRDGRKVLRGIVGRWRSAASKREN